MTRISAADHNASFCVVVCGGRNFDDRALLVEALDCLHRERRLGLVITGGGRGADGLAREWAKVRGIACEVYHTDWMRLRREAGRIKNERMLAEGKPDVVVAFPGGACTAHMVRIARDAGVEVIEATPHAPLARFALWPGLRSNARAEVFRWALSGRTSSRNSVEVRHRERADVAGLKPVQSDPASPPLGRPGEGQPRLRVAACASGNGGVAKSTLWSALAAHAPKDSKRMLHFDPQEYLASWWTRRGRARNSKLVDTSPAKTDLIEPVMSERARTSAVGQR